MTDPPDPLHSDSLHEDDSTKRAESAVRLVAVFYTALAFLGLGLILWRRSAFDRGPLTAPGPEWPTHLLATLGILAGVHWAARLAYHQFPSFRRGADMLIRPLGKLSTPQVAFVALASGVAEEIFFRGYLMNETGVWISSVVFGLIHWPPNRNWIHWPFFAAAMGFVMAWLYLWTASLLFPILLHVGINFLNLRMAIARSKAYKA